MTPTLNITRYTLNLKPFTLNITRYTIHLKHYTLNVKQFLHFDAELGLRSFNEHN